ncbi:O-antigen/teichoic acid export membrane protein [Microbacterium telephonicum]|uniref:O-antigen/teichoic acid export membrane protein n=2 Tax=Microbacterium telephonicum TaxID=1714841 RepID=A0A498BX01_9MICO|nr:O-antigen/teichoic acid export membrane protein [Microbacterium telephonicum]
MRARTSSFSALARSLGGFTAIQLVGFAAPFIALPVIARMVGAAEWVHLASAQAIGSLTAAVILFGWWTAGPSEYYRRSGKAARALLYRQSVLERAIVASVALPISFVVVAMITPPDFLLIAVLANLAMASYGFTPDWYFIAMRRPAKLALYETGPRAFGIVVGVGAILLTRDIIWYPLTQLVAAAIAYLLMIHLETPRSSGMTVSLKSGLRNLRSNMPIAASNILGAAYGQLTIPVASALATNGALAPYVAGDKLYKASRFTIVALGNTLQGWVLSAETYRRQMFAISFHIGWGIVGGSMLAVLTPWATHLLFGSELRVEYSTSIAFGVAFLFASITTPLVRNVLIPHGRRRLPLVATALALTVGLGGIWPFYSAFGVSGIGLAVAASEFVSAAVNGLSSIQVLRGVRREGRARPAA